MDSPNAMQNSSTSMLTSSGSGVNPSTDENQPSWNTSTIRPSVADSANRLNSSARSGCSTPPVNRNNSTIMMTAIDPEASHSRLPIASLLSTNRAASPPTSAVTPSGGL